MSGVTVATIRRSIEAGSAPAISSARRAAGRQMSVSASSSAAIRRSRMPVRSTIHCVVRVDDLRELVVVEHALGHVAAEAR